MSQATAKKPAATTSKSSAATKTQGALLRESPAVTAAVKQVVDEVRARSARITGPRGPIDGLTEPYEGLLARAGELRGRGLYYPYLGSGVGNGALVELADGSVKWDMICGIGVQFFGHSDPDMVEAAVRGSIDDTLKQGNLQSGTDVYDLCDIVLKEAGKGSRIRHAFVSANGVMANESALKLCHQKAGGAPRVIAFKDCFAGRSITMSQIGDSPANRVGVPLTTLVDYMPFFNEQQAAKMGRTAYIEMAAGHLRDYLDRYPKQHAAFIFELVQGEGGFNTAPREFFEALMKLCKERGVAVWDDEIQTFGRLESMFAYDMLGLGQYVDVVTVGKMTQSCFTLFTPEYNPQPGLLSGTFVGEGPTFRVGQRVVERLRDGGYYGPSGLIARHHGLFREHVKSLAAKHPEWFPKSPGVTDIVGGVGGMMRFTPFGGNKEKVQKACKTCFEAGVIVFYCGHGPYHVRMLPPLGVMKEQDWPKVFECVERGLAKAAG
jgi:4-aminobutyrate aminotransferase-like enzyme